MKYKSCCTRSHAYIKFKRPRSSCFLYVLFSPYRLHRVTIFFVFFFHFIFNVFCFLSICFVGYCFCLDSFSLNFCEYEFLLRWSCSFLLQICTRTWIDLSHWFSDKAIIISQRARHHGRRSKLMYIGHENESIFKSIRLFNLLLLIVVTYGKTCEYARVLPQGYLQEPNCLWIDGWIKIHITDSL